MPEMHSKQPAVVDKSGFTYNACGRFTKSKEKKNENLKKQQIDDMLIKANSLKLVFNMTWLMEI